MVNFNIDFYKADTFYNFNKFYKKLIKLGMSEPEAQEFLENLYWTVSNEYGN